MNGIIYARVSTKEQVDEGNSLETQVRLCTQYAKRNEVTILKNGVFQEKGESAKTVNRPVLKQIMQYCALNKSQVDCLIIYRIDRLSRETSDYIELKAFFNSLGIKLISISEKFDDNPVGRFIENTLAGVAQLDNEIRAERSKNGMIEAVREGRYPWQGPYGYINTRVEGKKNIAPSPDTVLTSQIRELWVLMDSGYTEAEATRIMANKGLRAPNGGKLRIQNVSKWVRNPIYKGVITRFGLYVVSNSIEPIVEPELWDRVLNKLEGKKLQPTKYLRRNPDYPLRGTLLCPENHRMTASAPRGNGGRYPKYHCPKCTGKGYSYDSDTTQIDFKQYINALEYRQDLKEALVVACELNLNDKAKQTSKARLALEKQLLELDSMDRTVTEKNVRGTYTDEHTAKILAGNDLKRVNLKLELNELDASLEDAEEIVEFGFSTLTRIGEAWEEIDDIEVKQKFQNWLFPAGLSYDGANFGTSQIPLCLSIKKTFDEQKSLLVTLVASKWNLICEEILRWYDLLRGSQGSIALPMGY